MSNDLQIIKDLAKLYKVKFKFNDNFDNGCGGYNFIDKFILLSPKRGKTRFIDVFFHELIHALSFRYQTKHDKYHQLDNHTEQRVKIIKNVAYAAEVLVDQQAEELFNFYFPKRKYSRSIYRTTPSAGKKILAEHFGYYNR